MIGLKKVNSVAHVVQMSMESSVKIVQHMDMIILSIRNNRKDNMEYKYNNGEIYQGDCLELMKDIPDKSIDMVLCDLP